VNNFWDSKERFSHQRFGGYLVTRLDGYTSVEARGLTVFALQSEAKKPEGTFLLDMTKAHGLGKTELVPRSPVKGGKVDPAVVNDLGYGDYNADIQVAGQALERRGWKVVLDQTEKFVGRRSDLVGYCSWGSNDPKFVADDYLKLRFEPGAIAETAVSTSARTFLPTKGGQSLIADLISGRVTGVKGYCNEPLLVAVASPTILFDRYTSGWTLAESFYAASRFVGWQDIVIGDPICAPYAKR
jgi:uncharacterized protein (TIGR03790 family)